MKTICALLLVGIVARVTAAPPDDDPCDHFAANIVKKEGAEKDDMVLTVAKFTSVVKSEYAVSHTTRSTLSNASKFCTAPTFGNSCKSVPYNRELIDIPAEGYKEDVKQIKFKTEFLGLNGEGKAIKFTMEIQGVNADDHIYQKVESYEITAEEYDQDGKNPKTIIPPADILKELGERFALYWVQQNGFAIYATCTGKSVWISKSLAAATDSDIEAKEKEILEKLVKLNAKIKERLGIDVPNLVPVETSVPKKFLDLISVAS